MSEPDAKPSSTGRLAAVEEHVQSLQKAAAELPGKVFRPGALTVVLSLVVGGFGAVSGLALAQGGIKGGIDAGVAPVAAELAKHLKDDAEARAAQARFNERVLDAFQSMEDRSAKRFDALQNTVLERRVQPESAELARPAPMKDGGR